MGNSPNPNSPRNVNGCVVNKDGFLYWRNNDVWKYAALNDPSGGSVGDFDTFESAHNHATNFSSLEGATSSFQPSLCG